MNLKLNLNRAFLKMDGMAELYEVSAKNACPFARLIRHNNHYDAIDEVLSNVAARLFPTESS
jgi:hypothetical protein